MFLSHIQFLQGSVRVIRDACKKGGQAIGTGVFFGMIFAIVFGIVLVPFFFVLIYKAKAKVQHKIKKD